MSRIALYLDDDTMAFLERMSKARGLSKSRWVAELIRQHAPDVWPKECLALAGRFADFPLRDAVDATTDEAANIEHLGF